MSWFNIVAMVTMAVSLVDQSEGCSCLQSHLQYNYCKADFVMQARLRGEGEYKYKKTLSKLGNETIEYRHAIDLKYNVKILKMFKVNENDAGLEKNSTVAIIHTPPNDGMCKVGLEQRTKYLLTGTIIDGQLNINLCSWGTPWAWVTKVQKKHLRFTYAQNCDCQPFPEQMMYGSYKNNNNICFWKTRNPDGECFTRQSACILDKNSSTGGCKWQRNQRHRQCRKQHKHAKYSILP